MPGGRIHHVRALSGGPGLRYETIVDLHAPGLIENGGQTREAKASMAQREIQRSSDATANDGADICPMAAIVIEPPVLEVKKNPARAAP